MIEPSLRRTTEEGLSFASRWRGQFRAAERAGIRYDQLARKYLQSDPAKH